MQNRKIPLRKCAGCGEMIGKKGLLRIVKTPEGEILTDPNGKKNGRGVYICRNLECYHKAKKKKSFERSLKAAIPDEIYTALQMELEGLEKHNE